MNATIIISAALVLLSVTGSAKASDTNYAYNTEMNSDKKVTTQTVYKIEDGKYLHYQVKYNFIYDAQNLLKQKEVLKWNSATSGWEKSYCMSFSRDVSGTTITYARWNAKSGAYSEVKEKAVYNQDEETRLLAGYQNFKWDKQSQQWDLVLEHTTIGWEEALYAARK